MYKIKDNCVVGGDKVHSPFGDLLFERVCITDNKKIADYFASKVTFTVTEIKESEGENDD